MESKETRQPPSAVERARDRIVARNERWARLLAAGFAGWLAGGCLLPFAEAQTVMVVGTRHLTGMHPPASAVQLAHSVQALSAFGPTQVCVERMSGERIEVQLADPGRNGFTFQPKTHGRALASTIVPIGLEMQMMLERRPSQARAEAGELLVRWERLGPAERVRVVGLQIAGFEFHSAVLNWSWLEARERTKGEELLGEKTVAALDEAMRSVHEVYSLSVPLARRAGLHELCTADSLADETAGIRIALEYGGEAVLADPRVEARFEELKARTEAAWQPEAGPGALTAMLRFFNSEEYEALDRRLQWETLRELDNDAGAFHRRLMYWHARTAEISAELFRALARGPKERVLFLVGSAHRPFTEADLRVQPWIEVESAGALLEAE